MSKYEKKNKNETINNERLNHLTALNEESEARYKPMVSPNKTELKSGTIKMYDVASGASIEVAPDL